VANRHQKLAHAIGDYLQWLEGRVYRNTKIKGRYEQVLTAFLAFVREKDIAWDMLFTVDTLKDFRTHTTLPHPSRALRGLSGYLYAEGKIPQPLRLPNYQIDLPDSYEEYLRYHEQSTQIPYRQIKQIRRVLTSLHQYLHQHTIALSRLTIEQVDSFLATLCPCHLQNLSLVPSGFLNLLISGAQHTQPRSCPPGAGQSSLRAGKTTQVLAAPGGATTLCRPQAFFS
jgi:hypothetical protein